ncbi:DUF1120 domain-containing protein [Pseudomonas poae]|uniref:DUF1120 domain-containing protein n=1 Tax=Pseudomonas poae TaxID=200451 RepID=A0A7M1KBQ4_9PSED|nr:DUF1120 domain-containing protein [Pseudomonas poae]QOQ73512.1 DUF1120 domain-containing protein [Pseudomonas poae]
MNAPFALLASALLLTGASTVFAASSVDLTVQGLITPSACTPSLSSGGVIDHGKVAAKDLSPVNWTGLGDHTLQLNITCEAPTLLALQGVDNRGGSPDAYNGYGLGLVDGKKLGMYLLSLDNATSGGAPISVLESRDSGLTWQESFSGDVMPRAHLASFGDSSTGSWAPTPVQNVTSDMKVTTMIGPTAGMNLANEIPILGSATVEVKYL